jgi:hypothetical protein
MRDDTLIETIRFRATPDLCAEVREAAGRERVTVPSLSAELWRRWLPTTGSRTPWPATDSGKGAARMAAIPRPFNSFTQGGVPFPPRTDPRMISAPLFNPAPMVPPGVGPMMPNFK